MVNFYHKRKNIKLMAIYKIAIIVFISIGITLGNPQKISIGGFKTSGITQNEINKLKTEIDKKILTTNGFSLIYHNNIYYRLFPVCNH